jgi:hypothetical protein
MRWLTTGRCARLINEVLEMEGAYSSDFIREEVETGALVARVYERRRQRTRIRIHPDDFATWAAARLREADQAARLRERLAS